MADYCGAYVYVSTHEFKSDIARWTRLLERGVYKALLVRRGRAVVGVYMTDGAAKLDETVQAIRARKEGPDSSIFDGGIL